jgi:hypothetical protein
MEKSSTQSTRAENRERCDKVMMTDELHFHKMVISQTSNILLHEYNNCNCHGLFISSKEQIKSYCNGNCFINLRTFGNFLRLGDIFKLVTFPLQKEYKLVSNFPNQII